MDAKRSNSVKTAMKAFCLVFSILFLVMFGSHYLSSYGFSLDPLLHEKRKLWWLLYDDAVRAMGGGIATGAIIYFAKRNAKGSVLEK
jgi:hypothetical protein